MRIPSRLLVFALIASHPACALHPALAEAPCPAGVIGQDGPSTFYATDVAVDDTGMFCVANRYHDNVSCYAPDGTPRITYSDDGFSHPRSLTFDNEGNLYVTDPGDQNIKVFDLRGEKIAEWPEPGRLGMGGITYVAPDRLYLACQGSKEIVVLDLDGKVVRRVTHYAPDNRPFSKPLDVAVSPLGRIYVSEIGRSSQILVFDENWGFIKSFGFSGEDAGDLGAPISLAVDGDGYVYVSERRNYRVSKFDADGEFVTMWGEKGREPGKFLEHNGISVAPDGTVWTAGYHGNDVQQFDSTGGLLNYYTGHVSGPGDFAKAFGVVEDQGRLFVSDFYNNRIQVFDAQTGRFQYAFGERGPEIADTFFNFPRAIAKGPNGDLYISDDEYVRRIAQDGSFVYLYPTLPHQSPSYPPAVLLVGQTLYQPDVTQDIVIIRDTAYPDEWDTWGAEGDTQSFNNVGALAVDRLERILVGDAPGSIQLFDRSGTKLDEWPVVSTTKNAEERPSSITYDAVHDLLYVSTSYEIQAWNLDGEHLYSWSHDGSGRDGIGWIRSIYVDDRGVLYASDFRKNVVNKYVYADDVKLFGEPEYRIGLDEGVFVWKQTFDGPYVVRANSGGDLQEFNVTLMTDESFVDVEPFGLERHDRLSIEDGLIELTTLGNVHDVGLSFNVAPGGSVLIGARNNDLGTSDLLRVGRRRMPGVLSGWILGRDDLPPRPAYKVGRDSGLFVGVTESGVVQARLTGGGSQRTDELRLFASDPYPGFAPRALEASDTFLETSHAATLVAQLGPHADGVDVEVCDTCRLGIVYRQGTRFNTRDVNSGDGSLGPPNAVLLPLADPYGEPEYARRADAVFIWKSADGMWHVRFTAESLLRFRGSIVSDAPFTSVAGYSTDKNDVLDRTTPGRIVFLNQVTKGGEDGIDFSIAPGASLEFRLDSNAHDRVTLVRVGGQRWPIAALPLDLSGWD